MTETSFAWDTHTDQGYLFPARPATFAAPEPDPKRRPGETATDYRIRRQYRDLAATPSLFPTTRTRLP